MVSVAVRGSSSTAILDKIVLFQTSIEREEIFNKFKGFQINVINLGPRVGRGF